MEIRKINLDRRKPSSTEIAKRQDFNAVLNGAKAMTPTVWKSPWFFGAVGLSSIAIAALTLTELFDKKQNADDKKITLEINQNQTRIQAIAGFPQANNSTGETPSVNAAIAQVIPTEKTLPVKSVKKRSNTRMNKPYVNQQVLFYAEKNELSDSAFTTNSDQFTYSSNFSESPVKTTEHKLVHVQESLVIPQNAKLVLSGIPSINGVYLGSIDLEKLAGANAIESNIGFPVSSYKIQFYDGLNDVLLDIEGDQIPEDIKQKIARFNIEQMIFVTEIRATDETGKEWMLPNMNLKIVH